MSQETTPTNLLLEEATAEVPMLSLGGQRYRAKCVHVYDGDTVHVVIEYGGNLVKVNVRLAGIDTPEMRPSKGNADRDREKIAAMATRNRVVSLVTGEDVPLHQSNVKDLLAQSHGLLWLDAGETDKYGRVLGRLILDDDRCINDILIEEGWAGAYDGGTKTPFASYFTATM